MRAVWNQELKEDQFVTWDEGAPVWNGPVDTLCQMGSECCGERPNPTFLSTGDANEPNRFHYTWVVVFDDGSSKCVCEDCVLTMEGP